jgi:alpha-ketoglutarate-dependent 2,4-dichlorophenoxyacetate dioxygenase
VLVFRKTGLDDLGHIEFSRLFGYLDDVTPYNKTGKKNRLNYDELFDVSNIGEDGQINQKDSVRAHHGKVRVVHFYIT